MKKNKEELKTYFERGDKPTEEHFSDLIDSYVDAKQLEGEANRRFVIDENGEVSVGSKQQIPEYTLSDLVANKLSLLKDGVIVKEVDLTSYIDDTNLARLVSGTVDVDGVATFKRDDNSTFTVDFSSVINSSVSQIQADWGQVDETKPDFIRNKTNITEVPICVSEYKTKPQDVIEMFVYVSELYIYQKKPSYLTGFTKIRLGGNVYPVSDIINHDPVYFKNPVMFSKGGQPLENDSIYWFSIIEDIIAEATDIGINFPSADKWSFRVQGNLRSNVIFYLPISEFPSSEDAINFINTYVGTLTDNPDLPLYVRQINKKTNISYVQKIDEREPYFLRKFFINGVEDTNRRVFCVTI